MNISSLIVTPVISTSVYSSGDNIGGVMEFKGPVSVSGGAAVLRSVRIWDKDAQNTGLKLLLFDCNPVTDGWTLTDNLAVVAATSPTEVPACVSIISANWLTTGGGHVDFSGLAMGIDSRTGQSRSIFAAIVSTGTPTYSSTSSLIVKAYFDY